MPLDKSLEHYEPATHLHSWTPEMLAENNGMAEMILGFNDWLNYHIAEPRYQDSDIPKHFGFVQALFEDVLARADIWNTDAGREWEKNRGY